MYLNALHYVLLHIQIAGPRVRFLIYMYVNLISLVNMITYAELYIDCSVTQSQTCLPNGRRTQFANV